MEWIPNTSQLFQFNKLIQQNPECKFKIGLDSCMVNQTRKFGKFSTFQEMSIDTCESGRMSVYVTPNMRLVPCSFADHRRHGVSLRDKSIEDVWNNSSPFRQCRYRLKLHPDICPYEY